VDADSDAALERRAALVQAIKADTEPVDCNGPAGTVGESGAAGLIGSDCVQVY